MALEPIVAKRQPLKDWEDRLLDVSVLNIGFYRLVVENLYEVTWYIYGPANNFVIDHGTSDTIELAKLASEDAFYKYLMEIEAFKENYIKSFINVYVAPL